MNANALLERLLGVRLEEPAFLLGALLVPLALLLRQRRGAPALLAAAAPLLEGLPRSLRARTAWVPDGLRVLALVLLLLALARPVRRAEIPQENEGIDILLVLDVSSSMGEVDLDPTHQRDRLEVAKAAAARFVASRPDDRIGLIEFAAYADVRCPLTLDHAALAEILGATERVERDGPEDTTGIGLALARAAQALRASPSPSKVVVLLSDGQETVATPEAPAGEIRPFEAAQLAASFGLVAHTIAVGSVEGGRELDPADLRLVAERTGGRFFRVQDEGALGRVYAEIDALEKAALRAPRYRLEERFLAFLGLGFALLVLAWSLQGTVWQELP